MLGQSQTIDATRKPGHRFSSDNYTQDDDNSDISELDMLTRTQISANMNQIDPH